MSGRRVICGVMTLLSVWLGMAGITTLYAGERAPYETEGSILAIMPEEGQILIDHEPIRAPGYLMGAMEMPFSVDNPTLLKGLKAGDHVRFRVSEEKKSRIVEIKKFP